MNVLLVALLVGQPALFPGPLASGRLLAGSVPSPASSRGNSAPTEHEEHHDAPGGEGLSVHAKGPRPGRRPSDPHPALSSLNARTPGRSVAGPSGPGPCACPLLFAGGVLPIRC